MVYNVSADLWYQYFIRNDGLQAWILSGFYGVRFLFGSFGILLNLSLVYVTVKSAKLHKICCILLALESLLSSIMHIGYLFGLFVVLSGLRFVPYRFCTWFENPCLIGGLEAQLLMLIISLDRLTSVLFPFWYKERAKFKIYMSIAFLLTAFGIFDSVLLHIDYIDSADVMVICDPAEIPQSANIASILAFKGLMLSGVLLVLYTIMWIVVYQMPSYRNKISGKKRRIIKSLLVICILNLFGVFIRLMLKFYFNVYPPHPFVKRASILLGTLVVINVYSANAPVLYAFSDEYRTEFNKYIKWLPKCFGRRGGGQQSNTITPIKNIIF